MGCRGSLPWTQGTLQSHLFTLHVLLHLSEGVSGDFLRATLHFVHCSLTST